MAIDNVAIVGRGALGLLFGSVIAENLGVDAVSFVMDDERYARHGGGQVTVNGEPCEIPVMPASRAKPADFVIVAVKATGLDDALDTMQGVVGPHTRIVSVLNGVTSEERIAARFGWDGVVISVAQGMDAVFLDGNLAFSHPGEIRFGAAAQTRPETVGDLVDFFTRAHVAFTLEDDILHRLWTKFMLNVGVNQACMVFGGTYGSISEAGGEQNRCFIAAMREALAVARAEGIDITEADLSEMAALTATLGSQGMPSMRQDRINGKRTEVDEFAGMVIRLAERHGILVPCNRWLYGRIREIEASYEGRA